ncbi:MAG: YciI family protein [Pseudohongiellaceae bacterium]
MKYLLLAYIDETIWKEGEKEACMDESRKLCHALNQEGVYVHASPLHDVDTATSVRVREGESLITDGPFAETHEQLGGYFMVNVNTLDEAMAIAARIPSARVGTIEIRPMVELDNMPEKKI